MRNKRSKKANNRKAAIYRRVRHSRLSVFAIIIIVGLLLTVISVDSKSLLEKDRALKLIFSCSCYLSKIMFAKVQNKYVIIHVKTKKYAEEMAKKKLGLVHENEIVFKTENAK